MNLTAGPGEPEPAATEPDALGPVPWEDPARPRLPGYFQTLVEVLWRPARFFARPARGGPGEPGAFGLITGTTGGLLGLFWGMLLLLSAGRGLGPAADLPRMVGTGALAAVMALFPLVVLAKLALASLCLWGAAALLGARVGWAPIWRLCCYNTAAAALALVPVLGSLLVAPLALFILHQGLRGALGMSAGRALGALAVFLFLQILLAAVLVGGFLALLGLGLLFLSLELPRPAFSFF